MSKTCILAMLCVVMAGSTAAQGGTPSIMAAAPVLMVADSPSDDTCRADADVNNDGVVLSVADYVHLVRFCEGDSTVDLPVPYKADLNGDCMIDYLDAEVYALFFEIGLPALVPYGGYPVPTCCDPDTIRGGCCMTDACKELNPVNCQAAGGIYWGDGTYCNQRVGDVNGDLQTNIGDAVYLISFFEKGSAAPVYMPNADVNGDCCVDINDIAFYWCMFQDEVELLPVACTCPEADVCPEKMRNPGDANGDGSVDVADAVYLIGYVFKTGGDPVPFRVYSGDANNDAVVNIGDAVYIIGFVFGSGAPPPEAMDWIQAHPCLDLDGNLLN